MDARDLNRLEELNIAGIDRKPLTQENGQERFQGVITYSKNFPAHRFLIIFDR